jgi:hypothetical protein
MVRRALEYAPSIASLGHPNLDRLPARDAGTTCRFIGAWSRRPVSSSPPAMRGLGIDGSGHRGSSPTRSWVAIPSIQDRTRRCAAFEAAHA